MNLHIFYINLLYYIHEFTYFLQGHLVFQAMLPVLCHIKVMWSVYAFGLVGGHTPGCERFVWAFQLIPIIAGLSEKPGFEQSMSRNSSSSLSRPPYHKKHLSRYEKKISWGYFWHNKDSFFFWISLLTFIVERHSYVFIFKIICM